MTNPKTVREIKEIGEQAIKTRELSDRIVKMLFDAGYDSEGAIRVIRMAREKYKILNNE